jgi:UDP:flavonoid glycosyltransferase YjiC (YdhE family)
MAKVKRLLFMSESVTLAQVVRLLVLARGVDRARFEVHFAASSNDDRPFAGTDFRRWSISGADPRAALRAASRGSLPSRRLIRRQIAEDLALFERVQPDAVIGDFRLSLAISAPLARVPLFTLINAYWSPNRRERRLPLPDHPAARLFGVARAEKYFERCAPKAMSLAASPINALRKEHGLSELGDLHDVLTFGDRTLYPDAPELTPLASPAEHERFIGPLIWSPRIAPPEWWHTLGDRPLVYVTLGSSGELGVLPIVLDALARLPVEVAVSTAGRIDPASLGRRVHAAEMLPGDVAARRAVLVITNGGSSTGYQALFEGTPVVGLASNLDQYLAMTAIERFGAGVLVRSGTAKAGDVADAVTRTIAEPRYTERARVARRALRAIDPHAAFSAVLEEALGHGRSVRVAAKEAS